MTTESNEANGSIKRVFDDRKKFMVLGLTGKTGSGCSSVAKLLQEKNFKEFIAPHYSDDEQKPKNILEEKKYKIARTFMEKNWSKFTVISMSDIVTSFIVQSKRTELTSEVHHILDDDISQKKITHEQVDTIIEKLLFKTDHVRGVKEVMEVLVKGPRQLNEFEVNDSLRQIEKLTEITKQVKEDFNAVYKGSFTKLYQHIGNNIRKSGCAYSRDVNSNELYTFIKRAHDFIKLYREQARHNDDKSVNIVIDAIRNPYEALYFQERYASFYLLAVSCDNETRQQRLMSNDNWDKVQIDKCAILENGKCLKSRKEIQKDNEENETDKSLDSIEGKKLEGKDIFWANNIQKCIEIADIHLNNYQKELRELKIQLVKYLSLILHPGIITPSHEECCMQIALTAKLNSGCLSRQVGAAITNADYAVQAIGWNSVPEGQVPCNLRCIDDLLEENHAEDFSQYERESGFKDFIKEKVNKRFIENSNETIEVQNGRPRIICFKDTYNKRLQEKNQVHTRALHAEENAFLQLSKYGSAAISGGKLFVTSHPCELCAKKAYQLNIAEIVYLDTYPGISYEHILLCGKKEITIKHYQGVSGKAYQKLYQPFIPYKDELEIEYEPLFTPKDE